MGRHSGKPMQRYFDGSQWTEHYAPSSQPVAGVVMTGGENHLLHAVLTLLTCGLWLPIWLIVAAAESKRPAAVDIYGNIIWRPGSPGGPEPSPHGPPAWLDKIPWLHKLPGDPMFWVILAVPLLVFLVLFAIGGIAVLITSI